MNTLEGRGFIRQGLARNVLQVKMLKTGLSSKMYRLPFPAFSSSLSHIKDTAKL